MDKIRVIFYVLVFKKNFFLNYSEQTLTEEQQKVNDPCVLLLSHFA